MALTRAQKCPEGLLPSQLRLPTEGPEERRDEETRSRERNKEKEERVFNPPLMSIHFTDGEKTETQRAYPASPGGRAATGTKIIQPGAFCRKPCLHFSHRLGM